MLHIQQSLYCPVCNARLGIRNKTSPFEELCRECDFYFYFPPNATKPTQSISRKSRENVCHCLSCEGRQLKGKPPIV